MIQSQTGAGDIFSRAHRLALGPTQPGTRQIPVALSPGVRCLEHETCHSPPCSAERNVGSNTSTHSYAFMACTGTAFLSLLL